MGKGVGGGAGVGVGTWSANTQFVTLRTKLNWFESGKYLQGKEQGKGRGNGRGKGTWERTRKGIQKRGETGRKGRGKRGFNMVRLRVTPCGEWLGAHKTRSLSFCNTSHSINYTSVHPPISSKIVARTHACTLPKRGSCIVGNVRSARTAAPRPARLVRCSPDYRCVGPRHQHTSSSGQSPPAQVYKAVR